MVVGVYMTAVVPSCSCCAGSSQCRTITTARRGRAHDEHTKQKRADTRRLPRLVIDVKKSNQQQSIARSRPAAAWIYLRRNHGSAYTQHHVHSLRSVMILKLNISRPVAAGKTQNHHSYPLCTINYFRVAAGCMSLLLMVLLFGVFADVLQRATTVR